MSDLIAEERQLVEDLARLVACRAEAEEAVESARKRAMTEAEETFSLARTALTAQIDLDKERALAQLEAAKSKAADEFAAEQTRLETEYDEACERLGLELGNSEEDAQREYKESQWQTSTLHEAEKNKPQQFYDELIRELNEALLRIDELTAQVQKLIVENRRYQEFSKQVPAAQPQQALTTAEPFNILRENLAGAEMLVAQFANLSLPRFFQAEKAKAGFTAVYQPLDQALTELREVAPRCAQIAQATLERMKHEVEQRRVLGLKRAEDKFKRKSNEIKARRDWVMSQTEAKYPPLLQELAKRREAVLMKLDAEHGWQRKAQMAAFDKQFQELRAEFDRKQAAALSQYEEDFGALSQAWQQGLFEAMASATRLTAESKQQFPAWDDPFWKKWTPTYDFPKLLRLGRFEVDIAKLPGGIPEDERLRAVSLPPFHLPAAVPFPEQANLLYSASDSGRGQAVQSVQAVMMRLLSTIPPGKLRYTIIDPVGLGENFAAFMHLADYDEQLVANRIWTEPGHIEQRLADLTEQMESIIQKFLRNEFRTIGEYNEQAGEVAEPFRILVVANFPTNFSESAARRLVSIASTGARCGVHTLVTVDALKPMPPGFNLRDLAAVCQCLVWEEGRFVWKGPFESYPLLLDAPPAADLSTRILREVGERARDFGKVEVPFSKIAPPEEEWWKGSTSKGISVALGPAGATKLQHLKLGSGTSQHVLVAGKTGSGKSTLLHAMITNLALYYSPEEVELYLIDFKKGVEFKTYATHGLPHARVVAIESEREFGLSVLERLDAELKLRGDLYRDAGAQDLASYRKAAGPDVVAPRILLIVDEFQEFFTEDDKIAQNVSLLLDRLVRQGRAFGIHVLLGSQTLGGAYSLARSTVGQMAVRIALQCSEADAHLILSEDNTAARLLSRPGEAIYNDANGLIEGNHPFQVAWLPDETREKYLKSVTELARNRAAGRARPPQIIFEGTVPADMAKNPLLVNLLAESAWPPAKGQSLGWLGESVAIKDPTAALFRRQSGANLLIVGQQEQSASAMMAAALVGLAAQHDPAREAAANRPAAGDPATATLEASSGPKFYVLEANQADAPHSGLLAKLAGVIPHPLATATLRDIPKLVNELASEVERRLQEGLTDAPACYLFIYDLARFRELRRKEDDYSFSKSDAPADPAKQLAAILRDGPNVGVHSLVWCDTLNNVNRTFDRNALREFEMRVLFQMSPADSSHLIDSPAASKLGLHRAYFHSEEQGRLEKFRPYGLPSPEWLAEVGKKLKGRK